MAINVKGFMAKDTNVSGLFEKFSIEEIREIEKKTRQDIEKKKEDLRQMVGERYRELIEAADTISEMKQSTEKVTLSIVKIQDLCQNLKQSFSPSIRPTFDKFISKDSLKAAELNKVYASSISLKMLMDIPEKIWSALDAGHYLLATRLYLLSRYIYTTLQLEGEGVQIAGHFPVMARQWSTIGHFKTTILQGCRNQLKAVGVSDLAVSECLCSILLLEDYTLQEAFEEFLSARKEAVQQLFQLDQSDVVIRSQITSVILMIVSTIHHIFVIFHHDHNKEIAQIKCNLLVSMLDQATSKTPSGAILSENDLSPSLQKYISKAIWDFRPTLRHKPQPISAKILKEKSQNFMDKCMKGIGVDIVKLLGYITTVEGLASIRDEIYQILKQDERMLLWDIISEQVLGHSLSVWNEVMRDMFVNRVKEILQIHFESMLSSIKSQTGKVLNDLGNTDDRMLHFERDLSSYIWSEGQQDIPMSRAWLRVNQKTLSEGGSLMMKARAYTPAVQSLCSAIDQNLKVLLEDAYHYTKSKGDSTQMTLNLGSIDERGSFESFDRFGDKDSIQEFLQNACQDCINKLLDHLKQQLYACKKQLMNSENHAGNEIVINRILLLGRFSGAICDLSSHLQMCMSIQLNDDDQPSSLSRISKKSVSVSASSSKSQQNPHLSQMQSKLIAFSHEAFSVWSEFICQSLVTQFTNVLNNTSIQAILSSCTQWDNIDIEEETEDNKRVKSTIRVPMQVSWYVQTLLYNLCHDMNRTGGHSIHYSMLNCVMQNLTEGILNAYESLVKSSSSSSSAVRASSLTQNRALQLWFDVKFLMNILLRKDETESSKKFQNRLQMILEKLETNIDPFDFDVFRPHLQNHLTRQTVRSNVLYGLLSLGDKGATFGSTLHISPSNQQEQHNILPLSSNQNRFSLLPLSIHNQPSSSMINPIIQPPKAKQVVSLNTVSNVPVLPNQVAPPRVASSSFLEQMSTIWFSNVTNKSN